MSAPGKTDPGNLGDLRGAADKVNAAGAANRLALPPPRGRIDPALALVLAALVGIFSAAGFGLASFEDARGYFDPALVEPVADKRALADFRAATSPIVDAVLSGDRVEMARSDGTIQSYDTKTELFSEDHINRGAGRIAGNLTLLSAGCGDRPQVGLAACPDDKRLFALTDAGGLVARQGGTWSILLSDQAWIGKSGGAVQQKDVVGWAVSDDGRWLLAAAGGQGMALFDQRDGSWHVASGGGDTTRIVYAHDAFWLAGPAGLSRLQPDTAQLRPEPVKEATGKILDLDLAADGILLALRQGSDSCADCLQILAISGAGSATMLVGEVQRSPGLSQAGVEVAALQDGHVVVLGAAGVHVYDPVRRNWTVLEAKPVDAYFSGTEGKTVYFSSALRFARIENGRIADERVLSEPLVQVMPRASGQVLAMGRSGAVLDVGVTPTRVLWPVDSGRPEGARFTAGAVSGDTAILFGPQGVLLHDVVQRRYAFQPASSLPPAVAQARQPRLYASAQSVWFADMANGAVYSVGITGDWPAKQVTFTLNAQLGRGLRTAQAVAAHLSVITLDGLALDLTNTPAPAQSSPIGAPLPIVLAPVAMTGNAGGLLFALPDALLSYDLTKRSWEGPYAVPDQPLADVEASDTATFLLTTKGKVYGFGQTDWLGVSAAGSDAALGSADLTDAQANGQSILLGGAGQVDEYLPDQRSFGAHWAGGTGDVRLLQPEGPLPVWLSAGVLRKGETQISLVGDQVAGAWDAPDGLVYLADTTGPSRSIVRPGASPTCFFRGSEPPSGEVIDARKLPDGRLIVLTASGAGVYDPQNRRWLGLAMEPGQTDSRLEVLGSYLVRLESGRLRSWPIAGIAKVGSCETTQVALNPVAGAALLDVTARAVTLDRKAGLVYLLGKNGAVGQWQNGTVTDLLPNTSAAPAPAELRRVYDDPAALLFAGSTGLWRYDLATRTWNRHPYQGAPAGLTDVDLTRTTGGLAVTLWNGSGQAYGGDEGAQGVTLAPFAMPATPSLAMPPDMLRDIALSNGTVALLGENTLELAKDQSFAPLGRLSLPKARDQWHVATLPGPQLLTLIDGPADTPRSLRGVFGAELAKGQDLASASWLYEPGTDRAFGFAATGQLWRIDAGQVIWACDLVPGAVVPKGCVQVSAAPMALAADEIASAALAEDQSTYLLRTTVNGLALQWLGADLRLKAEVIGPKLSATSRLFPTSGKVFLWEGRGSALWRLDQGRADLVTAGVLDIGQVGQVTGVTAADGLHLLQDGALVVPQDKASTAGLPILTAATLAGNGDIWGIDPAGAVMRAGDRASAVAGLTLPVTQTAVLPVKMAINPAERQRDLWLSAAPDGQVRADWLGLCPPLHPNQSLGRSPAAALAPAPLCQRTRTVLLRLAQGERMVTLKAQSDGTVLAQTTAQTLLLGPDLKRPAVASPAPPTVAFAGDAAPKLQKQISVVDGTSYLAAPALRASGAGFDVKGLSSPQSVSGVLQPGLWQPFSNPWLAWNRTTHLLHIGGQITGVDLAPAQAFENATLLPALAGRAAYLGQGVWTWANEHGLWRIANGQIGPVKLFATTVPDGLAHGAFLTASGAIAADSGVQAAILAQSIVTTGDLSVSESTRGGGVQASLTVAGRPSQAFDKEGFLFDNRLGIAALNGAVALLTPLGIVPARSLTGVLAVPGGTDTLGVDGSSLLARQGAQWTVWDGTAWQPAPAPDTTLLLAEESGRRWQRQASRVDILPVNPAETWRVARRGLAFDADHLTALAADRQTMLAMTGIGTIEAGSLTALAQPQPAIAADPGARLMDAQDVTPGSGVIWAVLSQGSALVWDRAMHMWQPPQAGAMPWQQRQAVDTGTISIDFDALRAVARRVVTAPDGSTHAAAFTWAAGGQMPFDRVQSMYADGAYLWLGSDFGLRRLKGTGVALQDDGLFVADGTAAPQPIRVTGRPAADPNYVLAETDNGTCLEMTNPSRPPALCADASGLKDRFVLQSPFWSWSKSDAAVSGQYLLAGGATLPIHMPLSAGLPHDLLRDRTQCDGVDSAELWSAADIVTQYSNGLPQRSDATPGVQGLHCQTVTALLGHGSTLPAGLYGFGAGMALQVAGGVPTALPSALAQPMQDRALGLVPWEAGRLRLRLQDDGGLLAEHRWSDDEWRALPWQNGRIAIDAPVALAADADHLWVATTAGVLEVGHGSAIGIDADRLHLAVPDDPQGLQGCAQDRIAMLDGSTQGLASLPGSPILLRCRDGQVWQGDPDGGPELGALAAVSPDPFVTAKLIDDPALGRWQRVDAAAGQPGQLAITFQGEAVALAGGRLSLDEYRALSAPYKGRTEVLAADGWWTNADPSLSMPQSRRDASLPDPKAVTAVWNDRDEAGAPVLCLSAGFERQISADGQPRNVETCREAAGGQGDPIWHWFTTAAGPLAVGTSQTGAPMQRNLTLGRFDDLVVTGTPTFADAGRLLVPTRFGALLLGPNGPEGLNRSETPLAALRDDQGRAVLLGPKGLVGGGASAVQTCPALITLAARLVEGAVVARIERFDPRVAQVLVTSGAKRWQLMMPCQALENTALWTVTADVAQRGRLRARLAAWPGSTSLLSLSLGQQDASLAVGGNIGVSAPWSPADDQLALLAAPDGRAFFAVTPFDLYRFDTDRAISAIMAEAQPLSAIPGPFTPQAVPPPPPKPQAKVQAAPVVTPAAPQSQTQVAPDMPPDPVVVLTGDTLLQAQTALRNLGFYRGKVDGLKGPRTTQAIRGWLSGRGEPLQDDLTQSQLTALLQEAGI